MNHRIVHIRDCAEVKPGFSVKGSIVNDPEGTLPVITAQHLTRGEPYRYREENKLLIVPPKFIEKYYVEPGDILFMSRGVNNYAVLLEEVPRPAAAPLSFYILKPDREMVIPEYLAWCLDQEPTKMRLNEMRTGAGTPMIPRQDFSEITIPLPPLSEQNRIATLASLQIREKMLLKKLVEETERLHLLSGKLIFNQMTNPIVE